MTSENCICRHWILLNPRDELHTRAKEVSASLGTVQFITSEMVLTELLNSFAARGMHLRLDVLSEALLDFSDAADLTGWLQSRHALSVFQVVSSRWNYSRLH